MKTVKDGGPVFRHFFGNPFGGKNPFGDKTLLKVFLGLTLRGVPLGISNSRVWGPDLLSIARGTL